MSSLHALPTFAALGQSIPVSPEFLLASGAMWLYSRHFPRGIAFTYTWWWLTLLSMLTGSTESYCVATCLGCGLVGAWYICQVVYPTMWPSLMPYWLELRERKPGLQALLSPRGVYTSVRLGDVLLHLLPATLLLHEYASACSPRHAVCAFLYERLWWWIVEGRVVGDGQKANQIYDFRPPARPQMYHTAQGLSTLLYCAPTLVALPDPLRLIVVGLWLLATTLVCLSMPTTTIFDQVRSAMPVLSLPLVMPFPVVVGLLVSRLSSFLQSIPTLPDLELPLKFSVDLPLRLPELPRFDTFSLVDFSLPSFSLDIDAWRRDRPQFLGLGDLFSPDRDAPDASPVEVQF